MKKSDLRLLIKEEINKLSKKPTINEGIITNFISGIVNLVLAGKAKQIDSLIDPVGRRDVIKASNDFKKAVQNYKDFLNKPDVKKDLAKAGHKPEDFPFYNL